MTTSSTISLPRTPLFKALLSYPQSKTAILHSSSGKTYTYGNLLRDVARTHSRLLPGDDGQTDLEEARVAMLVENSYEYVVSLLSIFAAGGIAVPLCTTHPAAEQRYVISDSAPTTLIATAKFLDRAAEIANGESSILELPQLEPSSSLDGPIPDLTREDFELNRGALIIYTSGTTSLPKGVIHTHRSLSSQVFALLTAWEITSSDHLLHVLPLHHVHGIVPGTLAPLSAGGTIEYSFPFTPSHVWSRLNGPSSPITLFMAVPTIYSRLLSNLPSFPPNLRHLRLVISGSAALPTSIRERWERTTSSPPLLERYGMTEIGMALSQLLDPSARVPNSVGHPLPGVEARLLPDGELQIRGDAVFKAYHNRPHLSAVMDSEGWFSTGDIAERGGGGGGGGGGAYSILGRKSVDVIKTGGEKVSALEVEREMLELPEVAEVAVVGVRDDEEWGQKVAAVVVLAEGVAGRWTVREMRGAMKKRVAVQKVPQVLRVVDRIPRNAMGKVNKVELRKEVFGE